MVFTPIAPPSFVPNGFISIVSIVRCVKPVLVARRGYTSPLTSIIQYGLGLLCRTILLTPCMATDVAVIDADDAILDEGVDMEALFEGLEQRKQVVKWSLT